MNGDGGYSFWQPVQADSQPKSSGLVLGRRPLRAILHSSNEPGELSQWLCHDDNTINIVLVIINLLPVIRLLERRARYLFYFTVCFFVRSTISRQTAGRFTPKFACGRTLVPDVSSPFLGVSGPGGRKKGEMKFSLLWESIGNFCILAVFERYLSNTWMDPHQILFV